MEAFYSMLKNLFHLSAQDHVILDFLSNYVPGLGLFTKGITGIAAGKYLGLIILLALVYHAIPSKKGKNN